MAITLRSTATTNSGSSTTPSVALPTSGATGDLLVVAIGHNDGTVTIADNSSRVVFDATVNSGEVTSVSTKTQALTTGNLISGAVFVRVVTRGGSLATQTVSTVTFNGASCSLIKADSYSDVDSGRLRTEIWGVAVGNLTTGSYNAVVTWGGTITRGVVEVSSWSGVDQASITEATGGGNAIGQASPITNSATTVTANAYLIDVVYSKTGAALTVGTNQTQDANVGVNGGGDQVGMSREGIVATPASTAMSWTYVTTDDYCQSIAVIKPASTTMTEDYDSGNDAGGTGVGWYTRVITGSEPATLNFTLSVTNRWAITAFIITGQNATIYDVAISTYDMRLATTTHTCAGCTTNTDNAWAIAFVNLDSSTNTFSAGPGGSWTQIATVNTQQPIAVYYLEKTTAGATGNASFTSTNSGNSLAMRQFAIKAATVAATSTYSTLLMMGV